MISDNEEAGYQAKELGHGIFGVWKPVGPTSHDVIDQLRRITGVKTIGHAGTLDPLAEGILVVAIGKENTRKIAKVVDTEKEYIAKVKLGFESETDDEEGPKTEINLSIIPTLQEIEQILPTFVGKIAQIPPNYSAIRIKGKQLYKLARRGKTPKETPVGRPVFIKSIEIIEYSYPYLTLKITTGKGAYIRAIARDLGRALKTGGYLAGLERTRVGEFTKAKSLTLSDFASKFEA